MCFDYIYGNTVREKLSCAIAFVFVLYLVYVIFPFIFILLGVGVYDVNFIVLRDKCLELYLFFH